MLYLLVDVLVSVGVPCQGRVWYCYSRLHISWQDYWKDHLQSVVVYIHYTLVCCSRSCSSRCWVGGMV